MVDSNIERLRANLKRDQVLRPFATGVAALGLIMFVWMLAFTWRSIHVEQYRTHSMEVIKELNQVRSNGFVELNLGNLVLAQCSFTQYQEHLPFNFLNNLGLTMTLVSRCELDYNYCSHAKDYLAFVSQLNSDEGSFYYTSTIADLSSPLDRNIY